MSERIRSIIPGRSNSPETQGGKFMAEKDVTEKILEANNDVFSDIINGCFYQGEKD